MQMLTNALRALVKEFKVKMLLLREKNCGTH